MSEEERKRRNHTKRVLAELALEGIVPSPDPSSDS